MLQLNDFNVKSTESILLKPKRLGCYSYLPIVDDGGEVYHEGNGQTLVREKTLVRQDRSAMRLLALPVNADTKFDLLEGYQDGVEMCPLPGIENILTWILVNKKKVVGRIYGQRGGEIDSNLIATDVICDSAILETIMSTYYARTISWSFVAVRVNGITYLIEKNIPIPHEIEENRLLTVGDQLEEVSVRHLPYTDMKFEQLVTTKLDETRGTLTPEGKRESFFLVNTIKVGSHRLLYSTRADCLASERQLARPFERMKFLQIRTQPARCPDTMRSNLMLSWWISCSLSSCAKVVVANKNLNNTSNQIIYKRPRELVKPQNGWSPKVCTDFLCTVLGLIRDHITNNPDQVFSFHYDATEETIFAVKLDQKIDTLLPEWYLEKVLSSTDLCL